MEIRSLGLTSQMRSPSMFWHSPMQPQGPEPMTPQAHKQQPPQNQHKVKGYRHTRATKGTTTPDGERAKRSKVQPPACNRKRPGKGRARGIVVPPTAKPPGRKTRAPTSQANQPTTRVCLKHDDHQAAHIQINDLEHSDKIRG